MKIGNTQYNMARWGDKRYVKMMELGFEAMDFSNDITDRLADCTTTCQEFMEEVRKDKKLIKESGIEIYQMHGPWRWPPRDNTPEDRADRLSRMQASIEACELLECKNWVIHNIMPFGHEDLKIGKEKETWEMNLEFFTELAKTAHKCGVTICIENMPMPNFSIGAPADTVRFINAMNDDCFKMCYDVGHAAVIPGVDPVKTVYEIKDYLRALHIHDNLGKVDQHFIPFFGVVDWEGVGKALCDIDFKGTFSLEVEAPEKLPDPYFEEQFKLICKIANHIANHLPMEA